MHPLARFTAMLMLSSTLAACSFVPDYERPQIATPSSFEGPQGQAGAIAVAADWWTSFNDLELQQLMGEALSKNLDIVAALARIDQAQGALRSTNSSLLPQVDASGGASRTDGNGKGVSKGADGSLSINYAIDLWGLYRAQSEASEADLRASTFDHEATVLLVQSSVATTYFSVLNLNDRLTIAKESLAAAQETLRLVQARYDHGAISALDLAQQKTTVASIEAGIPSLEDQLNASRHALAILLGRAPEGFTVATKTAAGVTLPVIAAGQPSELLERRPDIRRAEAQLQAANADIGAARAAFFPNISLSASKSVDWLAGAGTTNGSSIAASLLAPIFSGGQLEGNLQTSKARKAELAASYQKAVLTSFGEVEDALSSADANSRREASLAVASVEARRAYDLSQASYKSGASDFTSVLDAQRSWLSARDAQAQARLAQYTAAVNLFIALGGGWKS
ncbi:MAG TPA: efflux transporter outer membrane subunit [Parvibaculum sp.]|jgi:NodT family efflux transporter outer membrane factor (OMF) lipoprotein